MKKKNIHDRRQRVFLAVEFGSNKISFDKIVAQTGFSRNEVAHHIVILKKKRKIGVKVDKGRETYFYRRTQRDIVESFNEFWHGCPNPVHVYGVGYIDPNSRHGRRFLDP